MFYYLIHLSNKFTLSENFFIGSCSGNGGSTVLCVNVLYVYMYISCMHTCVDMYICSSVILIRPYILNN